MGRARGMTLIEVMISIAIGMVGLMGTLLIILTMFQGNSFSRNMTEASMLVQSQLEALVSQKTFAGAAITSTNPLDGTTTTTLGVNAFGTTTPPGSYTVTVAWSSTTTAPTMRQIDVTVTWVDLQRFGVIHSVRAARLR